MSHMNEYNSKHIHSDQQKHLDLHFSCLCLVLFISTRFDNGRHTPLISLITHRFALLRKIVQNY